MFVGKNPDKKKNGAKMDENGLKVNKMVKLGTKLHMPERWRTWSAMYKGPNWNEDKKCKDQIVQDQSRGTIL